MMTKRTKGGAPDFWTFARSYLHVELPSIRKASDKTIESYRLSLECYLLFLEEQLGIRRSQVTFDSFEHHHIKTFVKWMNEVKCYAAKTVGLRLTALRSFLDYAAGEDITLVALSQAAKTIKCPKERKRSIEFLDHEVTKALLSVSNKNTAKERRNKILLIVLYDTGARVSELTGIKVSDLHLSKPSFVSLLGKGNKPRNVPLMEKTVEHLRAYLKEFHADSQCRTSSDPLFYSNRDGVRKHLSADTVSCILTKNIERVRNAGINVPINVTCHTLRRTRAMDLYQEGVPLPLIMRLLGHESMNTTSAFYAFATMQMVAAAIESTSSLNELEPKCWSNKAISEVQYSLK